MKQGHMKRVFIFSSLLATAFIFSALTVPTGHNEAQAQGTSLAQMLSGQTLGWSSAANGSAAADTILQRDGAGILSDRNSTNAQEFRVYNTFTDSADGEWIAFNFSSNIPVISANANGTGTQRNLYIRPGNGTGIRVVNNASCSEIDSDSATFQIGGNGSVLRLGNDGSGNAGVTFVHGAQAAEFRNSSTGILNWSSGLSTAGGDTGLKRAAAAVVSTTNGSTGTGWLQNSAGRARLTSSPTNATATFSSLTDLTLPQGGGNLAAARKYSGTLIIWANNSTAAEGLQFDFNGGTATWTSFQAGFASTPPGASLALGTLNTTSISTPLTVTTATTANALYTITFCGVVNGAGTLIPRFAEVSHTSGTAQAAVNSFIWAEDSPN